MKTRSHWLIFAGLILISFILRLSLISKGPYHLDCLNLAIKAQETLDTGTLQNLFGPGYPLTVILGAFFVFLGRLFSIHDPVIMVNFMSVVFSSLAIGELYLICSKEFDQKTGIFAALLYSLTPIFLGISVYGKSHAPSIFFLLLSLYYFFEYNQTLHKKHLILGAVFLGFMGACRIQDMVLVGPAIIFLFFLKKAKFKKICSQLLILGAITGAVVFVFHLPYMFSGQNTSFKNQFSNFWEQGLTHSFRGLFSPALLIAKDYFLRTITPLGIILSFFGFFLMALKSYKKMLLLLIWFFVPLFFYGNLYTITPRLFAFSIIPLFIAQGYVLSQFFVYKLPYKILCLLLFFATAYMSLGEIVPPLLFRHQHALLPEYAQWVKSQTEDNAVIIIGSDHATFMIYYGGLKVMGKPNGRFVYKKEELLDYRNRLDNYLNEGIPLYIAHSDIYSYDFHKQFSHLIHEFYSLEPVGGKHVEFWHKGSFRQVILFDTLFRIKRKTL